jgi:hypothetical protein
MPDTGFWILDADCWIGRGIGFRVKDISNRPSAFEVRYSKRDVGCVEERNPTTDGYSASRRKKKEKPVWQRRFWEHLISDQEDLNRHIEYIHYNPVKHGLAKAPANWRHSSFHRFVNNGIYNQGWGAGAKVEFDDNIGYE